MGGIPVPALCPNQDSVCTHSSSEMWCGSVVVASTLLPCSFCQLQDPPRPWEIPCNQASQCPGLSKETLSHLGAKEPGLGMDPTEGARNTGSQLWCSGAVYCRCALGTFLLPRTCWGCPSLQGGASPEGTWELRGQRCGTRRGKREWRESHRQKERWAFRKP